LIIKNVKIFCMNNENTVLQNGFIEIENGKISNIGVKIPDILSDEQVIDGNGGYLLPGFIDAHCHVGVWEDSLGFEGDDGNEDTDPSTPHLRIIDGVNPLDRCFRDAMQAGITGLMLSPGSANPIAGQMVFVKTEGRCIDDMILLKNAGMKFALGENPKSAYRERNLTPATRMAIAGVIREQLSKAKRYSDGIKAAKADEDCDEIEFDMKCEGLMPVVEGKIPVHFHAHRLDDIFTAIRICKEFSLDYVLVHATEGHLIAKELRKTGVKAIAGPALCDRSKPELKEMSFETPGILSKEGILTAITTDHPATPIQYLSVCAALAVKEGMDEQEALKAITINAAKICKVDHRIGSIEIGKDGDLVLFDRHPFDIMAKTKLVLINGKVVFEQLK
jgi:imidazolonepropionase-like amidohydrolase